MENGELYGPRFLRPPRLGTSCSAASVRTPARGTASVTGQTCSALHCALAMDSVMETELIARPNTNSGLHYMPNYMYKVYYLSHSISMLDSDTASTRILYWKMGVSHSYCFSNCLRFETIGNYVYYLGHLGIQYAGRISRRSLASDN